MNKDGDWAPTGSPAKATPRSRARRVRYAETIRRLPRGRYDAGYTKSGSYFLDGEWTGVQVYDMTRSWYVDSSHARYRQEFPVNDENVVRFTTQAAYYWEHVSIDLR